MQNMSGIILVIILFILMYLFMIRPQKKRQKKHASLLKNLKKGDHVVTIGRLHGVVDEIDRDHKVVTLDCDGIYLAFDLNAIAMVRNCKSTGQSNSKPKKTSAKSNQSKNKDQK